MPPTLLLEIEGNSLPLTSRRTLRSGLNIVSNTLRSQSFVGTRLQLDSSYPDKLTHLLSDDCRVPDLDVRHGHCYPQDSLRIYRIYPLDHPILLGNQPQQTAEYLWTAIGGNDEDRAACRRFASMQFWHHF